MSISKSPEDWLNQRSTERLITLGLDRVNQVYQLMIKQQSKDFKLPQVITIAGTNGKGTSGFILSSLFKKLHIKVGWFSSPHFFVFNERIQINGEMINDDEIVNSFKKIEQLRKKVAVELSYFEYATLAALDLFIKHQVTVMILEVGLGGRFDAVNILDADIALITSIGMDHKHHLGDTKAKIANEKSGIFRKNKIALIGENAKHHNVLKNAKKQAMTIYQVNKEIKAKQQNRKLNQYRFEIESPNQAKGKQKKTKRKSQIIINLPDWIRNQYQISNCALVASALLLSKKIKTKQIKAPIDLSDQKLIGRFNQFKFNQLNFIVDVAHNAQAVKSLFSSFQAKQKGKIIALVNFLQDKDYQKIIQTTDPWVESYWIINLNYDRAFEPIKLAKIIRKFSDKPIHQFDSKDNSLEDAIETLNQKYNTTNQKQLVAFGCFALAEQIIPLLKDKSPKGSKV